MESIGRNFFILFIRMRVQSSAMSNLSLISQNFIKICPWHLRKSSSLALDESRTDDITQVSDQEKAFLNAPYLEREVNKAV
jgi:hypothetical protein